jgi:hypothetical protein
MRTSGAEKWPFKIDFVSGHFLSVCWPIELQAKLNYFNPILLLFCVHSLGAFKNL